MLVVRVRRMPANYLGPHPTEAPELEASPARRDPAMTLATPPPPPHVPEEVVAVAIFLVIATLVGGGVLLFRALVS